MIVSKLNRGRTIKLAAFWLILSLISGFNFVSAATLEDEIKEKERLREEIMRQIEETQRQLDATRGKSLTLQAEISRLNGQIGQIGLEIRELELQIGQTSLRINDTENKISGAITQINKHKAALAQYLKITNENDGRSLTEVLIKNGNLSEFFNELNSVKTTQENIQNTILSIKNLKIDLEEKKNDLEDKKSEMQKLKSVQEIEKKSLDQNKYAKDKLLKDTKGQESKYQELVKKSQKDLEAIKAQIAYLQQNGVSVEDAIKYGQMAAIATGIRPAFLIAILEVESGLGRNVGTGNWIDDMYSCYKRLGKPTRAEQEKTAFLQIVSKLNLNPDTVKVSREPNYGCGGALGPAQFLPTTWLAYEDRVARLTNHNPPNPWNIEDAFIASAIKLAAGGATSKTRDGEIKAAKAYVSGNPNCTQSICYSYSSMVLRKAAEIELNL
jgi:peptidoglycan hydrolase CwlO-like protein